MKKIISVMTGGGLILATSFASSAFAFQQTNERPGETPRPANEVRDATGPAGEFTSLHQDKITIKDAKGNLRSFQTVDQTDVLLNGKPAKLIDLRDGDSIRIVAGPGETALRIVASRGDGKQPPNVPRKAYRPDLDRNDQPARDAVEAESQTEPPNYAWLGLMLRDAENRQGLQVLRTFPSGPASRAGVLSGDRLLKVGDQTIASQDDLSKALDAVDPGDNVKLIVNREEKSATLTAVVGDRRDYLGVPPQLPRREENDSKQSGEEGFGDDHESLISEHSMMLEQHRRFAEQHQRIEEKLDQVLKELEDLRQQMGVRRGANDQNRSRRSLVDKPAVQEKLKSSDEAGANIEDAAEEVRDSVGDAVEEDATESAAEVIEPRE